MTVAAAVVLLFRLAILGGGSPHFVDSDNPASFSPHRLTRALTYSYLCALDFWLLLCPSRLCFDWSMGSIPLVGTDDVWRISAICGVVLCLTVLTMYGMCGVVTQLIEIALFGKDYLFVPIILRPRL